MDEGREISLYPVPDREGGEEDDRHDAEEYRNAPQCACKDPVGVLREHILAFLVEHDFFYYLAYEVVFLIDDVRLVAPVEHLGQLYGIFLAYLLVAFEQLQRVPAIVDQLRIAFLELWDEMVYLVIDGLGLDNGKF